MGRFKIEEVEISQIHLIDKNARYMEQTDFRALVENIKRDGELSSVPFCVKYPDGHFTVVSGNHRVEAAKDGRFDHHPCHVRSRRGHIERRDSRKATFPQLDFGQGRPGDSETAPR